MSTWLRFHSQYSPIDNVGSVNTGDSCVRADWQRLPNECVVINGKKLGGFKTKYNQFDQDEDVKQFFKDVILTNLNTTINKENVVNYLMTAFHQGGLVFPVSDPLTMSLFHKAQLQPWAGAEDQERELVILTTNTGFTIQEVYTTKKMYLLTGAKGELGANNEGFITPDEGKEFVIKAGAKVEVNFQHSTNQPEIKVLSNFISYGNSKVQAALDIRNFAQIIMDFLRNILGLNSVKDFSAFVNTTESSDPDTKSSTP